MNSAQQRRAGILPALPFKTWRLPEGTIPSETSAKRPACSADFQVARLKPSWVASLQPERLTDISRPRSGWNAGHQRLQVLKGQGKGPSLRRPFRDEKYFRMLVQALRAWLISGVASRQTQASPPIFSTEQLPGLLYRGFLNLRICCNGRALPTWKSATQQVWKPALCSSLEVSFGIELYD